MSWQNTLNSKKFGFYHFSILILIILMIVKIKCRHPQKNPYHTMELPASANEDQVKQKFRELSKLYHPDKINIQNVSQEQRDKLQKKYKEIGQAYEFIKSYNFKSRDIREIYEQKSDQGGKDPFVDNSFKIYTDGIMMDINIFWHLYKVGQGQVGKTETQEKKSWFSTWFMQQQPKQADNQPRKEQKKQQRNWENVKNYIKVSISYIQSLSKAIIQLIMERDNLPIFSAFFLFIGLYTLIKGMRSKDILPLHLNYMEGDRTEIKRRIKEFIAELSPRRKKLYSSL